MRSILLLGFFTFFFLPACKDSKTKEKGRFPDEIRKEESDKKPGSESGNSQFSITAPEGWTKKDTFMMGQQITFLISPQEDPSDDFKENVNVVTEKTGSININDYLDKSITTLKNVLNNFVQGNISNLSINGLEFKKMQYSHVYGGVPIDVDVYFTVKEGMGYVITGSAKGGTISKWEPRFEEAVQSFKVY